MPRPATLGFSGRYAVLFSKNEEKGRSPMPVVVRRREHNARAALERVHRNGKGCRSIIDGRS